MNWPNLDLEQGISFLEREREREREVRLKLKKQQKGISYLERKMDREIDRLGWLSLS